jgi:hypothetical protein
VAWLADSGRADATAFLRRVVRLDRDAVVRLRAVGPDAITLWSHLPFSVLVSRRVAGTITEDTVTRADELLNAALATPVEPLPDRRDRDWRWPLPADAGQSVERIPVETIHRISEAAAETLRTAAQSGVGGRAVGSRALRDALLDHVPIEVVTDDGQRVQVPQRLVQAVVRLGFAGPPSEQRTGGEFVDVRVSGAWTVLVAPYGAAWYRPPLALTPA